MLAPATVSLWSRCNMTDAQVQMKPLSHARDYSSVATRPFSFKLTFQIGS